MTGLTLASIKKEGKLPLTPVLSDQGIIRSMFYFDPIGSKNSKFCHFWKKILTWIFLIRG